MKNAFFLTLFLLALFTTSQTFSQKATGASAWTEGGSSTSENEQGKMISFKTESGKPASGYFVVAKEESKKYLFVFHEWWGLNDDIRKKSDKLHQDLQDVNILAIDLYDGIVVEDKEKAEAIAEGIDEDKDRVKEIIEGALAWSERDARVGSIGWGFGGNWALRASIIVGSHSVACVMYYGMPDDDVEDLKKLKAPVLGIFAEDDEEVTPDIVLEFEENMDEAEEELDVEMFDAHHAFANPASEHFDKEAAEKAYKMAIQFLKKAFEKAED